MPHSLILHHPYTPDTATFAFTADALPEWYCDQQFAVLPEVVLVFATLGDSDAGTRFETPSHLTWVPDRTDYHPDDEFPWLPAPVRETWDFQRQCRTKNHHLFVRKPGEGSFLYVGSVHLGVYGGRNTASFAGFELRQPLQEQHWIAFGGYSGWQVEVNHVRHPVAYGDVQALDRLLEILLQGEFGHLSITRYKEDSLHLHTNAQRGWLMYIEDPGDSGLYVRGPRQESDPEAEEEFYCGCGTGLQFPFRHTLSREEAVRAVRDFFLTGELSTWVPWGDEDDYDYVVLPVERGRAVNALYTADEILSQLDACAREFTFPMLDNGYVALGTARLTAYRDAERWALLIEVVGYNDRAGGHDGLDNALHLFGNCLLRSPGTANEDFLHPTGDAPDGPTFDDEFGSYVHPEARSIRVREELVPLDLSDERLAELGIELVEPQVSGAELLRSLVPACREQLLATEEELRRRLPPDLPQVLRLDEWHHPDLANDELPSQSETFRMIAEVLASGDVACYRPTLPPNTHWRHWPEGGTL